METKHREAVERPEEAIPLVIFNEQKKIFELNEEGRQYLESLEQPLGIVAVAGMYRTGKSYLLNRMLLDRSDGFGVGPTINPCTKGVWMWGKPIKGQTPEGDPINVIILDTEGLGALDEDSNHDVRIFSLAILLSSFFIYNSVGSIDENALQNLSLVINLTKHIQIKQQGVHEDVDPEEFAKYFPSFMWVVRDFTLQLVDQEGESMSAKEYLEKALQTQKGFSDSVESKNRIRRLLKSFFHERDCVTMIRPLTNEEKLQNLINIPLNELRPEFVEQVVNLRRKVLQRVKPKKINGKCLNGMMFWNLMTSYVHAINKGAIPSIESSWAYICKNECQKALDDAYDLFQQQLGLEMSAGGPFFNDELQDCFSKAKKQALQFFQKIAVGEVKEEFLDQLKNKMKSRFDLVKQDNDHTCEHECTMFLRQSYSEIDRALKNQQYPSFIDFMQDIEQFQLIFDEQGPPGSARKEIMLEFVLRNVMEASEFFMGNFSHEMNLQRQLAEETVRKLQEEIKELKNEQRTRLDALDSKIRKTEIEKAEMSAREQSTKEALQQLQREKDELQNSMTNKISQQKKDLERQIDELANKLNYVDEQKKDLSRAQISAESEFEKQKALLEQRIEFLEKNVEDSNRREKEVSQELKNSKKEFLNQSKEQSMVLEKQIKDQIKQIDELKEQLYDQENKNTDLEFQMQEIKSNLEDQNKQLQKELKTIKDQESDIAKKFEALKKKYDSDCLLAKEKNETISKELEATIVQLKAELKDTMDSFDMSKQSWEKEKAVLSQKLEFTQYQLGDEKKKYEENRLAHESMLMSLQNTNRESVIGREEADKKINQMEEDYLRERKKQEDQYNEYRKKLTDQVEQLKKKNNELELEKKLVEGEYTKENAILKDHLKEAETTKNEALERLKNMDTQTLKQLTEKEKAFKNREHDLERLIEEKDQEIEDMINEHNEKSEKQLNELKRFYEEEKERLEKRIHDEKARFDKKLNQTVEDYEEKLTELRYNHEEAFNNLEEEKNNVEADLQNLLHQLQKENEVMHQQLENHNKYSTELKENMAHLQNQASKQTEQMNDKFSKERKEMNERIDYLTSEVSKRDRAILSLENAKESIQTQLASKDKAVEEQRSEFQVEKLALHSKIDELKQKYDNAMDELTQSKINFERDKALKDQRVVFQEQRIKEYNDQMQQSIERYEERLRQEKEDYQKTLSERIARIQQEKENVETKYEQKRKAFKELEKQIQMSQSQHDKEKAVQLEKYENLEKSQQDFIKTLEAENQKLQEENTFLNNAISNGEAGIRDQVEHYKSQYYEMERLHADLQSELEKEKALWEGKFEFLEKQKDQAKKDNEDALKQFQQTVDQLQKSQNENKQKHEQNHGLIISQIEAKFKKELKEQQDQSVNNINTLNNTIRKLEKENKLLNEKIEINNKSLTAEAGGLEKKLERIQEDRDRLREECDEVKKDRENKLEELKRQFEREKEVLKQKNADLQQKAKMADGKQTELILSHETNRAKWDQEKSYLISAKDDAISELKNLQKRYENSVKEIERLKESQKRNNWKMNNEKKVGGIATNNPVMFKVGEGVLGRLNLGGAGGGLNRPGQNDVSASQNIPKGELGTYRSNFGVDKSMDNFKLGFSQQFGAQLNMQSSKLGLDNQRQNTFGAVIQPKVDSLSNAMDKDNLNPLDSSMRQSNILSTPSSKGGLNDDFDK